MDNKKQVNISMIFLIIAIFIIIIMGCVIYILLNSEQKSNSQIALLESKIQNIQEKLENVQNEFNTNESIIENMNNINNDNGDISSTKTDMIEKTEKEEVEEIIKIFVEAINEKNWETIEKYSSTEMVSILEKYNISNMSVDYSTLEKVPYSNDEYYCYDDYDFYYNGLTKKDLSLGNMFCIEKVDGSFIVTSVCATGL